MRLLSVRHLTTYRHSEPVAFGEHRMMFRPRASHDLRLIRTRLDIDPPPSSLRWLHDVFDNSVAVATFAETASVLSFDSVVTLEHVETTLPNYALEAAAQRFPFRYADEDLPDLVRALERRHPADDVTRWAAQFLAPSGTTDTLALLSAMTIGLRERLSYARRTERGVQTPSETLRRRCGTCRDFALLMIEAARSLGLAARFVSGYIFVPDLDVAAGVGEGATHAWLQVYLPGAGWVDFDPTNCIIGNRNLIRVAVAWDPSQVLPLWGTWTGFPSAFLGMGVSVSVIDETRQQALRQPSARNLSC